MKLARWIFGIAGVYGIPAITLIMQQRIKTMTLAFGCIDLVLGALFVLAFFFTPRSEASA